MKRMYPKQELGMPRECLHEKIVYLKETITTDTTIELDSLVPNWKDYDRIVINCSGSIIPVDKTLRIHVTNEFTGTLIFEYLTSAVLKGMIGILQGSDDDAPILHGIYARPFAAQSVINGSRLNNLNTLNYLDMTEGDSSTIGTIYGLMLTVYNKLADFSPIFYIDV